MNQLEGQPSAIAESSSTVSHPLQSHPFVLPHPPPASRESSDLQAKLEKPQRSLIDLTKANLLAGSLPPAKAIDDGDLKPDQTVQAKPVAPETEALQDSELPVNHGNGFMTLQNLLRAHNPVVQQKSSAPSTARSPFSQPSAINLTHVLPLASAAGALLQKDDEVEADRSDTRAKQIAENVYDALNWLNDEPEAIKALTGHDAGMRSRIQSAFQAEHGTSLRAYLKDQLGGDWLVKAIALLHASHTHDYHTAMALALIPLGTRDEEIFRILNGLSLAGRKQLEKDYNKAFWDIGEGSLKADLKDDLSGWAEEKSLALLHRDLTSADHLYFDSVAIMGTHTDSVVSRIQAEWDRGGIPGLERDWDQYVRNQSSWSDATWTEMGLYEAMSSELSGEKWKLVKAVLKGAHDQQQQIGVEVGPLTEEQLETQENIQLEVAKTSLRAAADNLGTNEAQIFRAIKTIREIWQARIERAKNAGDIQKEQHYRQQWEAQRSRLMATTADEMYAGGADYQRARLLTVSNLNLADEVYLAKADFDNDKVIKLVTQYWAQGKIRDLRTQSQTPRKDDQGNTVRPAYKPIFAIPLTHGIDARRVIVLVDGSYSDAALGARRLSLELDAGDSDSDLKKAYDVLNTKGISKTLQQGVIEEFASQRLSNVPGATATQKFLTHISQKYENSKTCYDFKDLLDPSTDPQEMVSRAEGRLEASRSGLLDPLLQDLVDRYDAVTAEDTGQVTLEALERLRFVARQTKAKPSELEAMMAVTGAANLQALAQLEYKNFKTRLDELRKLKQTIADAIATVAEITIELAITVATGGAAGTALVASLAAAVAGMLIREAALGQDYDLLSKKNAQQLVTIVAGQSFGALGRGVFDDLINPEKLQQLSRARTFLNEAANEAFTQLNTQILTAGLEGKMPTTESIAAGTLAIVGNSLGAGKKGLLMRDLDENAAALDRLRRHIAANIAQQTINGVSEEGAALTKSGTGNLTGVDIAARFGKRTAQAIGKGLTTGYGEVRSQEVGAARQARRDRRAEENSEQTTDDTLEIPAEQMQQILAEDAAAQSTRPDDTLEIPAEQMQQILAEDATATANRPPQSNRDHIDDTLEIPAERMRQILGDDAIASSDRSPSRNSETAVTPPPLPQDINRVRSAVEDLTLPDGTVAMPPPRRDGSLGEQVRYLADAHDMYHTMRRDDPVLEVAIYRNPQTGECIIIQGNGDRVAVTDASGAAAVPEPGGVAQQWKEILDGSDVGHWELVAHSHPIDPRTGVVADYNRFPTGANADFSTVVYAAWMSGEARSSRIDYETAAGSNYTEFGYNPSLPKPFWVNYPEPGTEQRKVLEFANLSAYHDWIRHTLGFEPGSVPQNLQQLGHASPRNNDAPEDDAVMGDETTPFTQSEIEDALSDLESGEGRSYEFTHKIYTDGVNEKVQAILEGDASLEVELVKISQSEDGEAIYGVLNGQHTLVAAELLGRIDEISFQYEEDSILYQPDGTQGTVAPSGE